MVPVVTFAEKLCTNLTFTDVKIDCFAPDNPTGEQILHVYIPGRGGISLSSFEYILRLDTTTLSEGSMIGGASMTITGAGFGNNINDVSVMIGDYPAKVSSVTDTELEVVAGPASRTVLLDNSAADQGNRER